MIIEGKACMLNVYDHTHFYVATTTDPAHASAPAAIESLSDAVTHARYSE